ncbi:MAG: response regulator [Magnetococcales bacterium]|nr:response regulator [Magnetococcales bacterium]
MRLFRLMRQIGWHADHPLHQLAVTVILILVYHLIGMLVLHHNIGWWSVEERQQDTLTALLLTLGIIPIVLLVYHRPLKQNLGQQQWVMATLAGLNSQMRGLTDVPQLCSLAIRFLVNHTVALNGAVYLQQNDGRLNWTAGYGLTPDHDPSPSFLPGEGLVGQVALEKQLIQIDTIPADCLPIDWGLVRTAPLSIAAVPLLHNDTLRGVLLLGAAQPFPKQQLELLQRVSSTIALAIQGVLATLDNQQLMEQMREQTSTLRVHQQVLDDTISQLKQASGYKSRFLASMSHELRSPLNSLLILSQLLMENKSGNLTDKQVEFAQTIHSAGRDLLTLIDEILDLARIEAGKIRIFLDQTRLSDLADSIGRLFQPVARNKGLQLLVVVQKNVPVTLHTDRQRVEQIIKNLISNAMKFTDSGGRVTVTFQTVHQPDEPPWVTVTVADTGIGIPADKQQLIFEPFRQVDDETNRKYGGTGLGLSISRELALLLEGKITLESTVGQGSTFTLWLPLRATADGTAPTHALHPGQGSATLETIRDDRRTMTPTDRSILIIGTDHELVRSQSERVRAAQFNIIVAGDQSAALFLISYYRPAALLLTSDLPGTDVAAFTTRARKSVQRQHLPILYLIPAGSHPAAIEQLPEFYSISLASGLEQVEQATNHFLSQIPVDPSTLSELPISPSIDRHAAAPTPTPITPVVPRAPQPFLNGRRLLIIEDDMRNIFALASLLEDHGAQMMMAENGRVGLEQLQQHPEIDLVLLDVMMPDMDGYQVLQAIRSHPQHHHLPVIVLTAKALQGERQRCLDAGASDYLPKPIDNQKLLSMIRIWLESAS